MTARSAAQAVYPISVASELSGVDPQTLRLYEQRMLLSPARTDGGTRRYSDEDLARLQRISELVGQGVNLAGVARILALQDRNKQLEFDIARLRSTGPAGGHSPQHTHDAVKKGHHRHDR